MTLRQAHIVGLVLITISGAILYLMGRDLICPCGYVLVWGADAPVEQSSKHMFDWYSPSHLLHGFIFFAILWLVARRLTLGTRAAIAVAVECLWEVVENTPWVINAYRELPAGAGYSGDSVLNATVDILCMAVGFWLARVLPVWMSVAIFLGFEALTLWLIRDGLMLNVLMLLWPVEAIATWQAGG